MSNPLVRRAIARGKSRQTIRKLLALEALKYAGTLPAPTPEVPMPNLLPDDVRASLEAAGWRPHRCPSVRACVIDLACYQGEPCGHCWQPALVGTPMMRGDRYLLLLECLHCGHQEAV